MKETHWIIGAYFPPILYLVCHEAYTRISHNLVTGQLVCDQLSQDKLSFFSRAHYYVSQVRRYQRQPICFPGLVHRGLITSTTSEIVMATDIGGIIVPILVWSSPCWLCHFCKKNLLRVRVYIVVYHCGYLLEILHFVFI